MSQYSSSQLQQDPNTSWYKVMSLISEGSKVLDIGCSSGNFGQELITQKGCIVDGVEISPGDFKLAQKKLRRVYSFNIEDGAPQELIGQYDFVYYGDVIEHLVDPVKALRNTKKLLSRDGKVAFSLPNMAHMSVRLMLLEGKFEYGETGLLDKTHLHFYDEKELYKIFGEAGYKIDKLDYVKRDIPQDVLRRRLAKMGLEANKRFLDASKGKEASAYQFVGLANPGDVIRLQRPKVSPAINEMEKHIRYMNEVHGVQIEAHKTRIRELESELSKAQAELESVVQSKSWQMITKVKSLLKR